MTAENSKTDEPAITLDEIQILRDQVANLSMKLAEQIQLTTRHQSISNQLAKQLMDAMQNKS